MVAEKYCQIAPKDAATISIFWKVTHACCLVIVSVCSLIIICNIHIIRKAFGERCILYAQLNFSDSHTYEAIGPIETNNSFHNHLTIWGNKNTCAFVKSCYIFSMVVGLIMLSFIIILPKGGHASKTFLYADAWKIVPLALLSSTIMTIFTVIASTLLKNGMHAFTNQIYNQLKSDGLCEDADCKKKLNMWTLLYNTEEIQVSSNISYLLRSSLTVQVAWACLIVSLVIRIILGIDFRVIIYNLKTTEKPRLSSSSVSSTSIGSKLENADLNAMEKRPSTQILNLNSLDSEADDGFSKSSLDESVV